MGLRGGEGGVGGAGDQAGLDAPQQGIGRPGGDAGGVLILVQLRAGHGGGAHAAVQHGGEGLPGEGALGLIEAAAHALDIAGLGRPGHRVGVVAGHIGEGGLAGDLRAAGGLIEELGRHAPGDGGVGLGQDLLADGVGLRPGPGALGPGRPLRGGDRRHRQQEGQEHCCKSFQVLFSPFCI